MGIFKVRKNKKYNYTPQHFDDKGQGNPYQIKHKFDDFRTTVNTGGLKSKIKTAWSDLKTNPDREANRRIFYIILILVFLFLLFIEFDLSIFFSKL